ncbi:FAD-dependent oxidoreductase [Saccharopolyspora cebuensis]|uniref:FAD-dependent oxidoreductase n=1 Tax=Saccharopolyspora cebuensis TaxID=418759 RepID=UPI0031EB08C4
MLINGAGIAGLALAWWLERDGHDVVLLERAEPGRAAGYMVDCQGDGYDAVDRMGLLPRLRRHAFTLSALVYHDPGGAVREVLPSDEVATERLISLMRGDLEGALREDLRGGDLRFGVGVDRLDDEGDRLAAVLTDGGVERADLLVGADGFRSRVRGLLFGPARHCVRELGFHAAAYSFTDAGLARSLDGAMHLVDAPGLQAGGYPVTGDDVSTLFIHRAPPATPRPEDPRRELRARYGHLGWLVPELLDRCPPPAAVHYDAVAQIELPAWHRGRAVLVGDACQAMSLLSGQGAGMALAGAAALADELRRDVPVGTALARYERRLRPRVRELQAEARATAEEFVP